MVTILMSFFVKIGRAHKLFALFNNDLISAQVNMRCGNRAVMHIYDPREHHQF